LLNTFDLCVCGVCVCVCVCCVCVLSPAGDLVLFVVCVCVWSEFILVRVQLLKTKQKKTRKTKNFVDYESPRVGSADVRLPQP
jgi:hypothetical protein